MENNTSLEEQNAEINKQMEALKQRQEKRSRFIRIFNAFFYFFAAVFLSCVLSYAIISGTATTSLIVGLTTAILMFSSAVILTIIIEIVDRRHTHRGYAELYATESNKFIPD